MTDGSRLHVKSGDEITNTRTGQRMVFRTTGDETGGGELIIECWSPPHPAGAAREPMHVHPKQEKRFRMIEGELAVVCDGAERVLRAGEEITLGPRQAHSFWNASDAPAHYWQEFRPALRSAEFFTTLFALTRDGTLDGRGLPSFLALAASGNRFHDELMVISPPPAVQRAMFAVLAPVARLFGVRAERS